jgi:hypothetical protein
VFSCGTQFVVSIAGNNNIKVLPKRINDSPVCFRNLLA